MGATAQAANAEQPNSLERAGEFYFDIPAQPLGDALEQFGAVTGLGLFYDGVLAAGHRSAPIKGVFPPMLGLETLLHGTGYVPRRTGSGAVSIVPLRRSAAASDPELQRYGAFFALLQSRVSHALCSREVTDADSSPIIFRFWLAPSGVIARAEIVGPGGDPARNLALTAGIRGIEVAPPPLGLPQPVTMAILPPLPGESSRCDGKP
ncbi:STN domain-containing protein [Blastochloris viridis]|nr:STN domain-containing protein [Blastochloris viridis]